MPRLHSCRCGVWSKVWECFLYILDMFLCLLKIEFSSLVWACVSSCQSVSDHINFDAVHIGGKKNVQCCHPQMEKYQKATFPSTTKCIMTMLYYIRKTYDHAMKPQMYFVRRDQMKLSGHHRQNSACFFFFFKRWPLQEEFGDKEPDSPSFFGMKYDSQNLPCQCSTVSVNKIATDTLCTLPDEWTL